MGIRRRGKKFLVTVELGLDEHGVRRRKCVTCSTEREAKRIEAELRAEVARGEYRAPASITCGEFLQDWLASARPRVSPTTWERYRGMVEARIAPRLGALPLAELSPLHLSRFYDSLREEAAHPLHGQGHRLSASTVRKYQMLLHAALSDAVRWQLLLRNPAEATRPDREVRKEVRWLTPEERLRLLKAAEGRRIYLPILLALATGMRRGEILGLQWEDIDFARSRLSIRRGLQWAEGRWLLGEGKTAGSRRVVNLPESLVSSLAAHRRQQQALRADMSEWHDHGFVFTDEHGEPFNLHGFESSWRHICHKAGLEGVRFHDLRHTHATELLRAGVHPKIVSERLGHSSVTMTLDRYSHAVPDLQSEAAEKTDALLRGLLGREDQQPPTP